MKVLIIRFSSLGDIILTSPVIRTLKAQLSEVEIHYATKAAFQGILEANPYVDHIHLLGDSLWDFYKELKAESFDVIIDLHHNRRTWVLKNLLRVKSYSYDKLNWEKFLMVRFKINRLPGRHIVDRYMDTIAALEVKMDTLGLDYFIPDKDVVEKDWLPETHRDGFYAVVVGGQHATKKLPTNRLIELCDRINKPIILLGGKEDQLVGEEIEQFFVQGDVDDLREQQLQNELGKKALVYNACGKFNFNQSASLVQQSIAVFTHDTGLMHVAAAFKKKVFSIWGNTIPEFGMYPYRTSFTIFENKKLGCRPCSKIGYNQCPKGHFKCMNDLYFDFWLPG